MRNTAADTFKVSKGFERVAEVSKRCEELRNDANDYRGITACAANTDDPTHAPQRDRPVSDACSAT